MVSFKYVVLITLLSTISTKASVIPNKNNKLVTLPLIKKKPYNNKRLINKRSAAVKEDYKLYNANKVEYLTKIFIGTPAQEFYVSIDTGSADTWVPSTQCDKSQCPYTTFDGEKSSTFKSTNVSFSLDYAQGKISGDYVIDKMNLLGSESKLTIDQQTFALANSALDIITPDEEYTSNGILGLGFPKLTANSDTIEAYTPFIFNLVEKKLISEPIFSISLNDKEGWNSELTLGGINHDCYSGELYSLPVIKNIDKKTGQLEYTFWTVQLNSINNVKIDSSVMFDTGTTLSYLTKELVEEILLDVTPESTLKFDRPSELYIIDCALKLSEKKINIHFKDVRLSISIANLILDDGEGQCQFGISYNFDSNNSLVFGDNILRTAFFAFDMEKKQVGIATAVHSNHLVSRNL